MHVTIPVKYLVSDIFPNVSLEVEMFQAIVFFSFFFSSLFFLPFMSTIVLCINNEILMLISNIKEPAV